MTAIETSNSVHGPAEYLAFPPQMTHDVEIVERREAERLAFVIGSASAGRFILLGETECRVLRLFNGTLSLNEVCEQFTQLYGARLKLATLQRFLGRLDRAGLLAGKRDTASSPDLMPGPQFYVRWKVFNPDRIFETMVARLRWIWTKEFVIGTLLLMGLALVLSMIHSAEITSYTLYTMREHYVAIMIAGLLIGVTHEFAHGLTCKAFGGRVPEVGVLMIYYLLPALYCNVSGAYLIPERRRRLWVILAGIYWQVLLGAFALLGWFIVEPHTLMSDVAFIFFLGSVVDVIFNANPLIKLDGYYFLSQWIRLPNLMDRSRSYWRALLKRILFGEKDDAARRPRGRERVIYLVFGLMSFIYTVVLMTVIVFYVGTYMADEFDVAGLMAAGALGLFYMRRPLGQIGSAIRDTAEGTIETLLGAVRKGVMRTSKKDSGERGGESDGLKRTGWRRRIVLLSFAVIAGVLLCLPWDASVGSYGTLVALPDLEAVVRAPENATLIDLRLQPGDVISAGSLIGRMGNLELEEQIVQAQSDLARANADYERNSGELREREETSARADLELERRRHDFNEISSEEQQINQRVLAGAPQAVRVMNVMASSGQSNQVSSYPAAIAVLQADVDRLEVQLQEASAHAERSRSLFDNGVVPQTDIESSQTRATSISLELAGARERLNAALVEHRRKYSSSSIEFQQARSDLRAEHLHTELFSGQQRAARDLIRVLESRLDLLRRRQAQFELVAPRSGTVYGEELPRMIRRYFQKGEEICRVADAHQLLVRIQVPEREIGDVSVGHPVRLRVRAYADRLFNGVVSKIGGESERDEHNQTTYRVELVVENAEGLLRPGMTAFARVDFGRRMIGQILMHKVRQLLRPEVWML